MVRPTRCGILIAYAGAVVLARAMSMIADHAAWAKGSLLIPVNGEILQQQSNS
jgi:hypothetical protein